MAGVMSHELTLRIPLESDLIAAAVYDALVVDEELQPEKVSKVLRLRQGAVLEVHFASAEWRLMRVVVGSFVEYLAVAIRCANAMPPPSALLTAEPPLPPNAGRPSGASST